MGTVGRIGAVLAALWLVSCAPQTTYDWGDYSQSMYDYYRDENLEGAYLAALQGVIAKNEGAGKRVPPGIYAEYGYMLMSAGRVAEASSYFEKEKRTWPESGQFMDTMIKYAANGGKHPDEPIRTAPADGAPQDNAPKDGAPTPAPGGNVGA
jgi:hypothetical protein